MVDKQTEQRSLSWEASFEIAKHLERERPNQVLENVSLKDIFNWTVALPEFSDDQELANDDILSAIYQEWYEEKEEL
jgi:FeS assembly protein IscX